MVTSSAVLAFSPRGYYAVDLLPFRSPRFGGHEEAALLLILGAFLLNVAIYLKAALGASACCRQRLPIPCCVARLHALANRVSPSRASILVTGTYACQSLSTHRLLREVLDHGPIHRVCLTRLSFMRKWQCGTLKIATFFLNHPTNAIRPSCSGRWTDCGARAAMVALAARSDDASDISAQLAT